MRTSTSLLAGAVALSTLAACRGEPYEDPPIAPIRNMFKQERFNPQDYTEVFEDKRTMRQPVEGTVAREWYEENEELTTGRTADDTGYVLQVPAEATRRLGGPEAALRRGQERFNIYCSPCHDKSGQGQGTVAKVQNGFPPLPKFTDARLRNMPDGQLYATITNGRSNMPAYAAQIPMIDRWAIVQYVRVLQVSTISLGEKK
jgi:mono/diheme cytochrome c family protein